MHVTPFVLTIMIDLTNNRIIRNGVTKNIMVWEVWFMTPFGIACTIEDANMLCRNRDLDPELNITPIPIARDADSDYEMFIPRR